MPQISIASRFKDSVKGTFHGCDFTASVIDFPSKKGYRNSRVLRFKITKNDKDLYFWDQKNLITNTGKFGVKEINDLMRTLNALPQNSN